MPPDLPLCLRWECPYRLYFSRPPRSRLALPFEFGYYRVKAAVELDPMLTQPVSHHAGGCFLWTTGDPLLVLTR